MIKAHNNRILQDHNATATAECNCRNRESYPLKGECLTENIVYMAQVSDKKKQRRREAILDLRRDPSKTGSTNTETRYVTVQKRTQLSPLSISGT